MTAVAAFTQVTHRIRNDDGSEITATWRQAQGVDDTIPVGQNFRLRFLIDENNSAAWTNLTWNLYYQKNGTGGYVAVSASTPVRFALSANFVDHADCTTQLTGGTGTFVTDNNGMAEAAGVANSGTKNFFFDIEFCLIGDPASITEGDYFDFRIYNGTSAIAAYTDTPRVTATKIHALVDKDMITLPPTVTKSVLGQVHVLIDKDMITSAPTVSKPTLAEAAAQDDLVSKDIISGIPTVTKSVIAQIHALVDKDIVTPVPTVTKSTIGQVHVLVDKDMITQAPTVTKSILVEVGGGGTDALISKNIASGIPTISKPIIGQVNINIEGQFNNQLVFGLGRPSWYGDPYAWID